MYFVNPALRVDKLHSTLEDAMKEVKEVAVTHPQNMQLIFKLESIYKPDIDSIQLKEVTLEDFQEDQEKRKKEQDDWMRSIGMFDGDD